MYSYRKASVDVHDRDVIPDRRGLKQTFAAKECWRRIPRYVDCTCTNSLPTFFKYLVSLVAVIRVQGVPRNHHAKAEAITFGKFVDDNSITVKLPWIFPEAPLKFNGAPGNIQDNINRNRFVMYMVLTHNTKWIALLIYRNRFHVNPHGIYVFST